VNGRENLGARIRAARIAAGLSQEDLGDAVKLSRAAISQWEQGQTQPQGSNLNAISEVLQVSLDYLAKGKGRKPQKGKQKYTGDHVGTFRRRPLIEHFHRLVETGALDDMLHELGYRKAKR
jgi:transcriptional regulator with XRE-family HTH domain